MYIEEVEIYFLEVISMIHNDELLLRGLASYYGMTVPEFAKLIGDDVEKLKRFYYDFIYNHN